MVKIISIIGLLFSFSLLQAQDSTRIYYKGQGMAITIAGADNYTDYIINPRNFDQYFGYGYYISGEKKSYGKYVIINDDFYKHGDFTSYYKSGSKKWEGEYVYDAADRVSREKGKWKQYYETGAIKEEWQYKIMGEKENLLLGFWDSTGKQLVTNGYGRYYYAADSIGFEGKVVKGNYDSIWTGTAANGKTYCLDEYKAGKFIKGRSWDSTGKEYTYNVIEDFPRYAGGANALLKFLIKNVKYPEVEKENDIQGRVIMQFVVERDGKVSDIKVVKGVSEGIDKESMRVTSLLPDFSPGKQRGQGVRVFYNLPIIFKLD